MQIKIQLSHICYCKDLRRKKRKKIPEFELGQTSQKHCWWHVEDAAVDSMFFQRPSRRTLTFTAPTNKNTQPGATNVWNAIERNEGKSHQADFIHIRCFSFTFLCKRSAHMRNMQNILPHLIRGEVRAFTVWELKFFNYLFHMLVLIRSSKRGRT